METIPLRHLAEVNPRTVEFDRLSDDDEVTFLPLETVWADGHADFSRRRPKTDVSTGYTRFRTGDVLVPKVTPTFQAGRVAIADLDTPAGAGTTELHIIRARPGLSDPRFLGYVCRSAPFLSEGVSAFQGVAGLQRVPDEYLRSFPVADLDLDEQRRIADFLDAETGQMDRLLALRRRQAAAVVDRTQRALDDLFIRPQLPTTRLKHLLRQRLSYGVLVPRFIDDGGVRLIRVNDLVDLPARAEQLAQIDRRQSLEYARTVVAEGDLLVSVVGTVGRSAVVPSVVAGSNIARAVARLQPAHTIGSRVLWLWTQSADFKRQVELATEGDTAQPTLNVGDLGNFVIALPTERSSRDSLTTEAATAVKVRDELLSANARQASLISMRRQALITAAVTGQIDVTTAGNATP